jgi:hypothetical protein
MWTVNFAITIAVSPGEVSRNACPFLHTWCNGKGKQVVGVCGSAPELGDWDVDKSVVLSTGEDGRVWAADVEFSQPGTRIA